VAYISDHHQKNFRTGVPLPSTSSVAQQNSFRDATFLNRRTHWTKLSFSFLGRNSSAFVVVDQTREWFPTWLLVKVTVELTWTKIQREVKR